ncbi:conserved hypothetical protein [Ixodes scapularis]|uniref:Phosphagen kinase N-terminal domain-containing protein n=1 Tax=Ixodes scapularis TaxID=6945 RepID=B7Q038_IXOSC|nr:conserved hypothetical protein [Ixodes scapularis]|eukprot:XP_002406809.1 conserved hypothetical protein [Ixodes scapularis]
MMFGGRTLLKRAVLPFVYGSGSNMVGQATLDKLDAGFEKLQVAKDCKSLPKNGVDLYTPDAESYTVFGNLLNPVIENYRSGFKATDKHTPTNFGDLNTLVNVDPTASLSFPPACAAERLLQGYLFNPCLTEAQYCEMEEKDLLDSFFQPKMKESSIVLQRGLPLSA